MEHHKQVNEQTTKKSHSLRKTLSRKRKAPSYSISSDTQQECTCSTYDEAEACNFDDMEWMDELGTELCQNET